MSISSYPKVYNLGHWAIKELFEDGISVEEKIDGSQFSFGLMKTEGGRYELQCCSHHQQIDMDNIPKMFRKAVETAKILTPKLMLDWIYRCEYLEKPNHNVLAYDRVPIHNLIIFDIERGEQDFLSVEERAAGAIGIGLESVPVFYTGKLTSYEEMLSLLKTISCLGGQQIEGLVFKNHHRFGIDKKILIGKHVRESFKEQHQREFKAQGKHIVQKIGESLCTEARWLKSIQHLKEQGKLSNSPKDIGPLLKEISTDVFIECADEIKEALFNAYWKMICKITTKGFPQWYKEQLAKKQFEKGLKNEMV